MIRINLLPHREARRKQNKNTFYRLLIAAGVFGTVVVMLVGFFIADRILEQKARNDYISGQNKELDKKIEEIAGLKQDIEALKARQQAVEDLQSDRNQPVYLLDELVKQVPEGVYLTSFKQEGQKVSMNGVAQSNERVSELLHNFGNNSQWLERPELIESRAGSVGAGRNIKRVFDFTMTVNIKRPRDLDKENAAKHDADNKSSGKTATPALAGKSAKAPVSATSASMPGKGGVVTGAAAIAPKKP